MWLSVEKVAGTVKPCVRYTLGPDGGLEIQSCMSQGSSDYGHSSLVSVFSAARG